MAYRAAIVGLGQVGMVFDDDSKRDRTWTHFSAYERSDRFELVAVCDPNPTLRDRATARRPSVRPFASLDELLGSETFDVVSICTPIDMHARQVEACASHVRAIACEKPLSLDVASGEAAVGSCATSGTLLAVNYYKRFEAAVQDAARTLRAGEIGTPASATALYSGPLDAVGSHALDLLDFLVGPLQVAAADGVNAVLSFGDGGAATLLTVGPREDLVFEIDVIGSEGRMRLTDNCARLEVFRFESSNRYDGYRELRPVTDERPPVSEPFLALFSELADALDGQTARLTSDGTSALRTQSLLDATRADVARI